jgi:hypothetical protein
VVELTTKSQQEQAVAKTNAEQRLAVAKIGLDAVKARSQAIIAEAQANADVIRARNRAEIAGLSARVEAFEGDGGALAQNLLVGKLAPAFRSILSNSDGPLMELFGQLSQPGAGAPPRGASPGLAEVPTPLHNTPNASSTLPAQPFARQPENTEEAQP